MTRAAWFFVGLTLLGVVGISIGIGMLESTLPDGGWLQIAFGLLLVAAGIIRLVAVLSAARKARADEQPQ
jgi:cytochrome c biogenesis protein CcdA